MPQSNAELLRRLGDGDESALETIIEQNIGLVRTVAKRFADRGTEFDDLMQIGTIGLMRAARSFDFSFGCMFSTYAVPLIIGEIRRFLRDDGLIKVSRSVKTEGAFIMRKKEEFTTKNGREPTISELACECSISSEEVMLTMEAISPVHSLSERVGSAEDGCTLENFIGDRENPIESLTDRLALRQAISKLSPCRQQIVNLRYFRNMSQQQTGAILGLTQVKVSREEKKILEELRKSL